MMKRRDRSPHSFQHTKAKPKANFSIIIINSDGPFPAPKMSPTSCVEDILANQSAIKGLIKEGGG
jgi:hypothetical protein